MHVQRVVAGLTVAVAMMTACGAPAAYRSVGEPTATAVLPGSQPLVGVQDVDAVPVSEVAAVPSPLATVKKCGGCRGPFTARNRKEM